MMIFKTKNMQKQKVFRMADKIDNTKFIYRKKDTDKQKPSRFSKLEEEN